MEKTTEIKVKYSYAMPKALNDRLHKYMKEYGASKTATIQIALEKFLDEKGIDK